MPTKVLHVLVPEPPGEVGGADMHVRDLAVAQKAAGMAPVVIERGSHEFAGRLRTAGVEVISATGLSFRAAVRLLADEIEARSPDIVHAHGYDADYWAAATRWRFRRALNGRPLIFTQHGVVEDTLWHRAKTLLDAVCMRAADGVIVCAPGLGERMERWCPNGVVRYIPNGVHMPETPARADARRALGLPPNDFFIAYVGRLSPEKRPDRVLTLVADARSDGLSVNALIVGSGPLREDLERQARDLGVEDAVRFTGFLPTVGNVYGAADAFVLLSDTETTSRVVIEAMSAGVPVLASAVGGVPELLAGGEAGWLVAPDDRTQAVQALGKMINEPGSYREVAQRRARELFAIDVMRRSVGTFYEDLVKTVRPDTTESATVADQG